MQNDKQHIDDFFRQKDANLEPDLQHLPTHWHQLQTQLATPGNTTISSKGAANISRRLLTYLGGGVVLVTVVTVLLLVPKKQGSKKQQAVNTGHTSSNAVVPAPVPSSSTKKVHAVVPQQRVHKKSINHVPVAPAPARKKKSVLPGQSTIFTTTQDAVDKQPDALQLLQTFYNRLQKQPQTFTIAPNRDTILTAAEGTQLSIPAHAFISNKGNVTGKVFITVEEFYRYADMVAARLTTSSNKQQLVSGGMLHITAQNNGAVLQVAPDKSITVNMPTNQFDKDMKLFIASDTSQSLLTRQLNWQQAGALRYPYDETPYTKITVFNIRQVEPYQVSYDRKTTAYFYVDRSITIPISELQNRLRQRFGTYYEIIKIRKLPKRKSPLQKLHDFDVLVIDSVHLSIPEVMQLKLLSGEDSMKYAQQYKDYLLASEEKLKLHKHYTFNLNTLGWINCDRFMNDPRPKATIVINPDKTGNTTANLTYLVFGRYRSVMSGHYEADHNIRFYNVPIDEPVTIVSVGVKNNETVGCIKQLIASEVTISDLHYEPVTPEQFKQKLQAALGSLLQ